MLAIRKILVPVDDSPLAEMALGTALSLAQRFGAEVYPLFVRATQENARDDLDDEEVERDTASLWGTVQGVMAASGTDLPSERIHPEVRTGDPEDAILSAGREYKVDLIVMGTHGRKGIADWLRGSTTERVLLKGHAPGMLVIKEPGDPTEPR